MGTALGLGVGVGLLLVWLALTSPLPDRPTGDRPGLLRARNLLARPLTTDTGR